jgi:hypothetical protein
MRLKKENSKTMTINASLKTQALEYSNVVGK